MALNGTEWRDLRRLGGVRVRIETAAPEILRSGAVVSLAHRFETLPLLHARGDVLPSSRRFPPSAYPRVQCYDRKKSENPYERGGMKNALEKGDEEEGNDKNNGQADQGDYDSTKSNEYPRTLRRCLLWWVLTRWCLLAHSVSPYPLPRL